MGVIFWLLFGVVVGALSSLLNPGQRTPSGVAVMILLGTLGALLGGFVGRALGLYPATSNFGALVMAALGSIVLLAIYHAVFASRRVY